MSTRVKICPNCGKANREWRDHCSECHTILHEGPITWANNSEENKTESSEKTAQATDLLVTNAKDKSSVETYVKLPIESGEQTQPRKLTVHYFPVYILLLGIIFILVGVFIYIRNGGGNQSVAFATGGLLFILLSLSLIVTVIIDKDVGTMSIKSIWRRQVTKIPLSELRDIQVEANEGDDGTRLVAIKTDGTIIPFGKFYIGLSSYKKRVIQLRNFIGLSNDKTLK